MSYQQLIQERHLEKHGGGKLYSKLWFKWAASGNVIFDHTQLFHSFWLFKWKREDKDSFTCPTALREWYCIHRFKTDPRCTPIRKPNVLPACRVNHFLSGLFRTLAQLMSSYSKCQRLALTVKINKGKKKGLVVTNESVIHMMYMTLSFNCKTNGFLTFLHVTSFFAFITIIHKYKCTWN